MPTMTEPPTTTDPADPADTPEPVAAVNLCAGQRITIGRYRVQLVEDPTPAPRRVAGEDYREIILLVQEFPIPQHATLAGVWSVTVGADQLFTLL